MNGLGTKKWWAFKNVLVSSKRRIFHGGKLILICIAVVRQRLWLSWVVTYFYWCCPWFCKERFCPQGCSLGFSGILSLPVTCSAFFVQTSLLAAPSPGCFQPCCRNTENRDGGGMETQQWQLPLPLQCCGGTVPFKPAPINYLQLTGKPL